MVVWIIVGVAVVTLALFAFWPRRRGVVDGDVDTIRRKAHTRAQNHSNPSNPQFNGPI